MSAPKPVIAVVFYSMYGHIKALGDEIIKGIEATGATVKPYVFAETLPEEVLTKMHAGPKADYPVITPDDLKAVDGFVIGAPTRFGRVPAQVSSFFDQCGQLWFTGALQGKFVTMFTSTATQHGGQESTFLTTMPFFAHHGLVYVPQGTSNPEAGDVSQVQGISPYGVSTVAGADGSRQPTKNELTVAESQGKYFATFVSTFVKGRQAAQ